MPRPRPDRPTEPLSIWLRTHTKPGPGRSFPVRPRWPESRWFWAVIAALAVSAIGLFSTALVIGPISLPSRLVSLPSISAGGVTSIPVQQEQTHSDATTRTAPGNVLATAPVLFLPSRAAVSSSSRSAAPRASWRVAVVIPASTVISAPVSLPPSSAAASASGYSAPVHARKPRPTTPAPVIVPSVPFSPSVLPDPPPIPSDPGPSNWSEPGNRKAP